MKYRNKVTNGYHSKREANRAAELKMLADAGIISGLREQVPFLLIPKQRRGGRVVERECNYFADFVYRDEMGALRVEDTKGVPTKDYIIKRKLMLHVHGIRIEEV